jgi:hypothetical protein
MRESHIVLTYEFFKLIDDLLYRTPINKNDKNIFLPFSDIRSFKCDKFLLSIKNLALFDNKLRLVNI